MPANVAFTLRMPADKPQLAELIASYRDFNVDETLLAPDDSALQHWYHWLLIPCTLSRESRKNSA